VLHTLNDFVYKVEHLISKGKEDAHINRLRWYHNPSLNVTTDLKNQIFHDGQELQVVENFTCIRQKGKMCQVHKVAWIRRTNLGRCPADVGRRAGADEEVQIRDQASEA